MTEPFAYSFDTDQKSRIDDFNEVYPDQDFKGLTEDQIDSLLTRFEEEVAAQGVAFDDDPNVDDKPLDFSFKDESKSAPETPVKAPVSPSEPQATDSLSPAAARALLVSAGVPVGKRGRLSPDQWTKARELASDKEL